MEFTQKVSSTYLKTFFGNFEEVYGHHDDVKIVMKTLSEPTIEISDDVSKIRANVKIRFLNPHNSKIEAIRMEAELVATAKFDLIDDFRITG